MTQPLLDDAGTAALRTAVQGYTVDTVQELLGPIGQAALGRGDLTGVARAIRAEDTALSTLVRLFLLGERVTRATAVRALSPLSLEQALAAGLVLTDGDAVAAQLDLRPHAAVSTTATGTTSSADSWVVSDFGADVRGGPLRADHVLGIGSASLTLAQATPRGPVGRALDVGTGCGIQSLHLSGHAAHVTATDVSTRALRMAATTAALSGLEWDLRLGSLLEPVREDRFDLVVANPPFVVSAGDGGYDYRDSGLTGDEVSRRLVTSLPSRLAPGGTAQLLANWIIPVDGDWQDRLDGWFEHSGCDAWVWQREIVEPAQYVALWLRDAGTTPGTTAWTQRYDAWLDWFADAGVAAVGMGLITLWRSDRERPTVVIEDVPQAVEQPAGAHLSGWVDRQRSLAALDDDALLATVLSVADGVVLDRSDLLTDTGWSPASARLRLSHAMRWDVEVDDAVAALVAGCDGRSPLLTPLQLLASMLGEPVDEIVDALLPVVRDLVSRGFLLPPVAGAS